MNLNHTHNVENGLQHEHICPLDTEFNHCHEINFGLHDHDAIFNQNKEDA